MASSSTTSETGTRDQTYDLVSVLYHALKGADSCQTYAQDGGEHAQFFEQAGQAQRQIADQAKHLLHDQLMYKEGVGQNGG